MKLLKLEEYSERTDLIGFRVGKSKGMIVPSFRKKAGTIQDKRRDSCLLFGTESLCGTVLKKTIKEALEFIYEIHGNNGLRCYSFETAEELRKWLGV